MLTSINLSIYIFIAFSIYLLDIETSEIKFGMPNLMPQICLQTYNIIDSLIHTI